MNSNLAVIKCISDTLIMLESIQIITDILIADNVNKPLVLLQPVSASTVGIAFFSDSGTYCVCLRLSFQQIDFPQSEIFRKVNFRQNAKRKTTFRV